MNPIGIPTAGTSLRRWASSAYRRSQALGNVTGDGKSIAACVSSTGVRISVLRPVFPFGSAFAFGIEIAGAKVWIYTGSLPIGAANVTPNNLDSGKTYATLTINADPSYVGLRFIDADGASGLSIQNFGSTAPTNTASQVNVWFYKLNYGGGNCWLAPQGINVWGVAAAFFQARFAA